MVLFVHATQVMPDHLKPQWRECGRDCNTRDREPNWDRFEAGSRWLRDLLLCCTVELVFGAPFAPNNNGRMEVQTGK